MSQPAQNPQSRGWTPARRAAQSAAIRRWSPWTKSTGPRTITGKARAARNAAKHTDRPDPSRLLNNALRIQAKYVHEIIHFSGLQKNYPRNELLKKRGKMLVKLGHRVTAHLIAALTYAALCKNLAKTGSLSLKVSGLPSARHAEGGGDDDGF